MFLLQETRGTLAALSVKPLSTIEVVTAVELVQQSPVNHSSMPRRPSRHQQRVRHAPAAGTPHHPGMLASLVMRDSEARAIAAASAAATPPCHGGGLLASLSTREEARAIAAPSATAATAMPTQQQPPRAADIAHGALTSYSLHSFSAVMAATAATPPPPHLSDGESSGSNYSSSSGSAPAQQTPQLHPAACPAQAQASPKAVHWDPTLKLYGSCVLDDLAADHDSISIGGDGYCTKAYVCPSGDSWLQPCLHAFFCEPMHLVAVRHAYLCAWVSLCIFCCNW